jgi:hypothetical protein
MMTWQVAFPLLTDALVDLLSDGALLSFPINDTLQETLDPAGGAGEKVIVRVALTTPVRTVAAWAGSAAPIDMTAPITALAKRFRENLHLAG